MSGRTRQSTETSFGYFWDNDGRWYPQEHYDRPVQISVVLGMLKIQHWGCRDKSEQPSIRLAATAVFALNMNDRTKLFQRRKFLCSQFFSSEIAKKSCLPATDRLQSSAEIPLWQSHRH